MYTNPWVSDFIPMSASLAGATLGSMGGSKLFDDHPVAGAIGGAVLAGVPATLLGHHYSRQLAPRHSNLFPVSPNFRIGAPTFYAPVLGSTLGGIAGSAMTNSQAGGLVGGLAGLALGTILKRRAFTTTPPSLPTMLRNL